MEGLEGGEILGGQVRRISTWKDNYLTQGTRGEKVWCGLIAIVVIIAHNSGVVENYAD